MMQVTSVSGAAPMERTSLARWPCPIARAADQLGDTWRLVILRDVYLGMHRFAALQESLGIAPNMLKRRLDELVRDELLVATAYSERPQRFEYSLTEKGADVLPVLLSLAAFGNRWLAPKGEPLVPVSLRDGRVVEPQVVDAKTRKPLKENEVGLAAGPGAPQSLRRALSRQPRTFSSRRDR